VKDQKSSVFFDSRCTFSHSSERLKVDHLESKGTKQLLEKSPLSRNHFYSLMQTVKRWQQCKTECIQTSSALWWQKKKHIYGFPKCGL